MSEHVLIRVFLSSPGDVNAERGKARAILDDLKHDPQYKDKMDIEIVAWDDPHSDVLMPVTLTPQEAINRGLPRPSQCQVVITIFWGRMGTPLDETAHGLKADGTPYGSGTEWEYLDALQGSSTSPQSLPIVYLYRRTDEAPLPKPREGQTRGEAFAEYGTQLKRVEDFFKPFRDSKTGAFKAYYHEYDSLDTFDTLMKKHLRILLTHAYKRLTSKGKPTDPPPETEVKLPIEWDIAQDGSPFPGLKSFEERHEKVYYGRAREVAEVIKRMASQRLQVIVGASGSGKSSLVKAGVLPKLRDNALPPSARWHRVTMRPGSAPFAALQAALQQVFPPALVDKAETLAKAPENLHRMLARHSKGEETVLFIDQFEELFTSAKDDADAFIAMLKYPSEYLRVLVTIRSDFYDVLLTHFEKELRESTFTLAKPSALALVEMIERPADVSGLAFEGDLVEQIMEDAGTDAGSLALIAYMLDELYNAARRRGQSTLTQTDYQDFGGVQKVIGTRAEQVFSALRLTDPEKTLQRVFHALVTVDERSTRQSAERRLFANDAEAERLIDAFIEARLFTSDKRHIEVAHEALLREWKLLAEWIARSREQRMMISRMQRESGIWQERGKPGHLRPNAETLKDFHEACGALQVDPHSLGMEDFIEPEQERLYREIEEITTDHKRRSRIGERLATIDDSRYGIGCILLPSPSAVGARRGAGGEGVLLPQIDWLLVSPGGEIKIEKHRFTVKPFYVAKYLITYQQFQAFLDAADGFRNECWWEGFPKEYIIQAMSSAVAQYDNYPRDSVSWYQAVAFSRWVDAKYREYSLVAQFPDSVWEIRLPMEQEWQWMAQGGDAALKYPWGEWDEYPRANTTEAGIGDRSTAVGMYPHGAAECGALDVAGNLWEWCLNDRDNPEITDGYGNGKGKVLRGGSFNYSRSSAAASYRGPYYPNVDNSYGGFRLVLAPPISAL